MAWSKYHTSVSKPVVIRGVRYPSLWQAAKALGCHPNNISKALKEGWIDRAGIRTQAKINESITNNHGRDGQLEGKENARI